MPDIEVRSFNTMVSDTLRRIINSTKITNVRPGSIVRTMVEAILAEQDIQYYQINRIFQNMDIDTAVGTDLERLVKMFGIIRKQATQCVTTLTFGRSAASSSDILIPTGSVVSTRANGDGEIIEFIVTEEDAYLPAGSTEVLVECTAKNAGVIYVPANTVVVMNKPIMNIEYVNNNSNIYGGLEEESDVELRARAKGIFATLGKSTISAVENAVMALDEVKDVICVDCARGVGTADLIVVTSTIPPDSAIQQKIDDTISEVKAAGVDVVAVYPTIKTVNVSVNITNDTTPTATVKDAIIDFVGTLGVGDTFIINQLEKAILNVCDTQADIRTIEPVSNVTTTSTEIIRYGTITINGVVI